MLAMHWNVLQDETELTRIISLSASSPQVIFKHSTSCAISAMAKARLERSPTPLGIDFYCLDLLKNRQLSNRVAELFKVWHESPQLLLIVNGECVYDESHIGISMAGLLESINN
jgi:bacillithiol system protein YtxJ